MNLKNHSHLVNLLSFYSAIQKILSAEISLASNIYFLPTLHYAARVGGATRAPAASYAPGRKNCEYHFCALKQTFQPRSKSGTRNELTALPSRYTSHKLCLGFKIACNSTTVSNIPMKCIAQNGV